MVHCVIDSLMDSVNDWIPVVEHDIFGRLFALFFLLYHSFVQFDCCHGYSSMRDKLIFNLFSI